MAGMRRAGALVAVALVTGTGLGGCTSGKKSAGAQVTVTASGSTTATTSASSTASVTPSAALARTRPTKPVPTLPRCETVLPETAVDQAMAHHVTGRSAFVVNQPDPTISQLSRINCQYGLGLPPSSATARGTRTPAASTASAASAGGQVAQVEVSVSLYATRPAAAARITATESEWRSHGASAHRVSVGAHPGTVLLGYGRPLLVLASGVRTVAVSVRPGAVASNRIDTALSQIARTALSGSGG